MSEQEIKKGNSRELKFRAWVPNAGVEGNFMTEPLDPLKDDIRWLANYPLMQYTNLKDKNGKEIYEGDIVRGEEHGHVYPVKWNEDCAGFYPFVDVDYGATSYYDWPLEVIGNVYENPDLI